MVNSRIVDSGKNVETKSCVIQIQGLCAVAEMGDGVRVEGNVIEFRTGKPIDAATIELVLGYIARGWNPVPVPYRTKGPQGKDWDKRRVDVNNAAQYFPPNQSWNIGIQLGPMSGNLVDLDLDCPEGKGRGITRLSPSAVS
jgi:hypothetical protein